MALRDLANRFRSRLSGKGRELSGPNASRQNWVSIYHRGKIDERLIQDVFKVLEHALSQLDEETDWALVLYLLYVPEDDRDFGFWESRRELKRRLAEEFLAEAMREFGEPLGSDRLKEQALQEWGYSLELPDPEAPLLCRCRHRSHSFFGADFDIYLAETAPDLAAPGRFAAMVRALPIVSDSETLRGVLVCEGNVSVARHVDMGQRQARGRQELIYLTQQQRNLLVGPQAACDLLVPSLKTARWIRDDAVGLCFDADNAGAKSVARSYMLGEDFSLRYFAAEDGAIEGARTFGEVLGKRANIRDLSLQVVARVLPRASGAGLGGYGSDWCQLSGQLGRRVLVSIRLDSHNFLAVDTENRVFIQSGSSGSMLDQTGSGPPIQIGEHVFRWVPDTTGIFYGSLYFEEGDSSDAGQKHSRRIPSDQPLLGVIARGGLMTSARVPLLTEYTDDDLMSQRGSLALDSDGRGFIDISATKSAAHGAFFVLENSRWRRYRDETVTIKIDAAPCEFVIGSSRYRIAKNGKSYGLRPHWTGHHRVLTTDAEPSHTSMRND